MWCVPEGRERVAGCDCLRAVVVIIVVDKLLSLLKVIAGVAWLLFSPTRSVYLCCCLKLLPLLLLLSSSSLCLFVSTLICFVIAATALRYRYHHHHSLAHRKSSTTESRILKSFLQGSQTTLQISLISSFP